MLQLTSTGLHIDRLPAETASIDVQFDGRRIWSIDLRDRAEPGSATIEWPSALLPHLRGSTVVTIADSGSGSELDSCELRFDDADDRTAVADADGTPLVVNKWGWLGVALEAMSEELQGFIVERSQTIVELLSTEGFRPFVVGGTLLGGVRNGQLLPHDDDADIAYLSRHTNPADVAVEAFEVGHLLERAGYELKRHSATHMQLLFRDDHGGVAHYIDVFTAFFMTDGTVNQPFHVRGSMTHDQMLPFSQITISGVAFPAPADTDRWLTINYDENWRTPIPGFQLDTPVETRRRFDNWFGGFNFQRDFWDAWFASDPEPMEVKGWETGRVWLTDEIATMTSPTVVDLGCGRGQLTHAMAKIRPNTRVLGLDFSEVALSHATERASEGVAFGTINLARMTSLTFARTHHIERSFDVVSNHLMDQLGHRARAYAWRIMRMALRSGGEARFTFHARHASAVSFDDPTGWHVTEEQVREEAQSFGLDVTFTPLSDVHHIRNQLSHGRQLQDRSPYGATVRLLNPAVDARHPSLASKEHLMSHSDRSAPRRFASRVRRFFGRLSGSKSRVVTLERELLVERERITRLEAEIDELRHNSLRVAELIDLTEQTLTPVRALPR